MLDRVKNYIDSLLVAESTDDTEDRLQIATTALLIEMMRQDNIERNAERKLIMKLIRSSFPISEDEAETLYQLAAKELDAAVDYYQFTKLIARHFTPQQKITVIENLWKVAFADHALDALEEHMVRRIAGLIHVSHRDFIRTKYQVKQSLSSC